MAVQNFDKLNNIQRKDRHIPYDEWFGEIAKLGEQEIAQRIAMAQRFEDSILNYLSMMRYSAESGFGGSYGRDYLRSQYRAIAYEQFAEDAYIDELADGFANDFHRVTKKHLMDDDDLLMLAGSYWFSQDRAMVTAENTVLDIFNYEEFLEALAMGYTQKTWVTMGDNRVRDSHTIIDGTTIPLDEVFHLDGGDMRFPRDADLGASDDEISGCRCWLEYS